MELNFNELRELVAAVSQTDIAELTLKSAEFELTLRKPVAVTAATAVALPSPMGVETTPAAPSVVTSAPSAAPAPPPAKPTPPPASEPNLLEITSPMVGTFYRSPAPDEAPFVEVGARIQPGQTVCIIEAMKLMNELEAEFAGEIVEILVQNAEPVEYGQALMLVRPA